MNEKTLELKNRIVRDFTYHPPPDEHTIGIYECIRSEGKNLAITFVDLCPPSRELSLALTNLEQAVMWANAAIARNKE